MVGKFGISASFAFPPCFGKSTHVHLITPNFTCTNSISGLQELLVCQQNDGNVCPPSLWDISDQCLNQWHVIIAMELACCQDLSSCPLQKWSIMCSMLSFIKKVCNILTFCLGHVSAQTVVQSNAQLLIYPKAGRSI